MARRPYAFAIWVALGAGLAAIVGALLLDLPLRDPDGVAGPSYIRLPAIVLLALAADVVPRAWYRTPKMINFFTTARLIIRERWTWARVRLVIIGLGCFYLSYVAYRNIKSFLPFVNRGLHDGILSATDQFLAFGNRPAVLLHDLLGTGFAAHALSSVYVFYLFFVPISLAAALVWSGDAHKGFWYVTALCLNWVLGAASYYILPSLGPAYAHPGDFTTLPDTGVASLQESLFLSRVDVLTDPHATTAVHGIAAFASLHVSVVVTAALIAHRIGLHRWLRTALWFYTGVTVRGDGLLRLALPGRRHRRCRHRLSLGRARRPRDRLRHVVTAPDPRRGAGGDRGRGGPRARRVRGHGWCSPAAHRPAGGRVRHVHADSPEHAAVRPRRPRLT